MGLVGSVRLDDLLPADSAQAFYKFVKQRNLEVTVDDLENFFGRYEKILAAKNIKPQELAHAVMRHLQRVDAS